MSIYCVYLTIYRGNKLPPFYIGSTSLERISKGYRGSVRSQRYREIFEKECLENPHLFTIKIIKIFQNRKDAREKEDLLQRQLNVIKNDLYINMAYANGCFGGRIGHTLSEETRRKIGEKSKRPKTKVRSQESKNLMAIKMTKIHKEKKEAGIKIGLSGNKNPMFGKTPTNARKCIYDGIEFKSVKSRNEYITSKGLNLRQILREIGEI